MRSLASQQTIDTCPEARKAKGAYMTQCARVMRFKAPLDGMSTVERVIEGIVPKVRALDGCDGFLFLTDRLTGRAMAVSLWDSDQAMQRSESVAGSLSRELMEQTQEQILSIERFEVAVDLGSRDAPDAKNMR